MPTNILTEIIESNTLSYQYYRYKRLCVCVLKLSSVTAERIFMKFDVW